MTHSDLEDAISTVLHNRCTGIQGDYAYDEIMKLVDGYLEDKKNV